MVIAYCAPGIVVSNAVDVALVYSLDRGVTFSEPIVVTNAAPSETYTEVAIALSTDGNLLGTYLVQHTLSNQSIGRRSHFPTFLRYVGSPRSDDVWHFDLDVSIPWILVRAT